MKPLPLLVAASILEAKDLCRNAPWLHFGSLRLPVSF